MYSKAIKKSYLQFEGIEVGKEYIHPRCVRKIIGLREGIKHTLVKFINIKTKKEGEMILSAFQTQTANGKRRF